MSSPSPIAASSSGYMAAMAKARGWGPSTSTAIVAGDWRKIHTTFTETGVEMVEEYDFSTDDLLIRKIRSKTGLGAWGSWNFEVGEPVSKLNPHSDLMLESSSLNPMFVRQDLPTHFQFRIRNLPYDYDNYIIGIDDATQEIVLKTKNKKYYKRMSIPDLKMCGNSSEARLQKSNLEWKHANNTLIISYLKPAFILEQEARNRAAIRKMGTGSTATTGAATSSSSASKAASSAAQQLVAEAQASSNSNRNVGARGGGANEFGGLSGLKGLANKDGDCKQQ